MKTGRLLEGAYDIHLHASPDVIPRSMNLKQLCHAAEEAGMAGMLIKDHCTSTVGRVAVLNHMSRGICRFYSSLALNPPVGSLNPTAVEAALRAGTTVIYFPTYGAAHHIRIWGAGKPPTAFPLPDEEFKGVSILDRNDALKPEALDLIALIKEFNAVLSTGHISPAESLILLRQARKMGLEKMIVTHASESVSAFTIAQQREAVDLGAVLEHSFFATTPSCPDKISIKAMSELIRAVGAAHVILSSDFGQIDNGNPVKAFQLHLEMMIECGFTREEIRQMIVVNPENVFF